MCELHSRALFVPSLFSSENEPRNARGKSIFAWGGGCKLFLFQLAVYSKSTEAMIEVKRVLCSKPKTDKQPLQPLQQVQQPEKKLAPYRPQPVYGQPTNGWGWNGNGIGFKEVMNAMGLMIRR